MVFPIQKPMTGQIDASSTLQELNALAETMLQGTVPPAENQITLNEALDQLGLPVLSSPIGGMSLDSLISAIGNEARRQACKDGINSLELKAQQQKEVNDKQLEQLQKQLEEMKKKEVLNGFLKAFKIIGMIVGAIASIATIAVGAVTGNPLLIAAGVIGMALTIDSVLSMATDGKISMMAGFEALGKACGMDDETAKWFAFGMQMAVMVVSIGVSLGAGFASSAGGAVNLTSQAAQKALDIAVTAQKIMSFASAGLSVAQGSATIAGAVIDYNVAKTKVSAKELEAILERIREAMEADRKLVESEMERVNDLLAKVAEIVQGMVETQAAILTTTPATV